MMTAGSGQTHREFKMAVSIPREELPRSSFVLSMHWVRRLRYEKEGWVEGVVRVL
jgi:hypothetical protein